MASLKDIISYSKANPNTDYAKRAGQLIKSGGFDEQAQKEGIDLSWAGRPRLPQNAGKLAEAGGGFQDTPKPQESEQQKITRLTQEATQSKATAAKANSPLGLIGQTIKGTGEAIASSEVGLGKSIAKVASSGYQNKLDLESAKSMEAQLESTLKLIHDEKGKGRDVTKLAQAYNTLYDHYKEVNGRISGSESSLPTPSEVAGQLGGVALDTLAAGTYGKTGAGGAIEGMKAGELATKAPTIAKVATPAKGLAAKVGKVAAGAGIGYAQDVTQGLQGNRGEDRTGGNAFIPGAGTVIGAAIPATTETVGAIKDAVQNRGQKAESFVKDLVTPNMTTKDMASAIKTGKVTEGEGLTGKRNVTNAVPNFKNVVESVKQVPGVSNKNTLLQNTNAIHDEIGNVAENLKSQLKGKGSFTPNEFKKYMNGVKSQLAESPLIVGDSEKVAQKIIDKFTSLVEEHGYTPEGLLNARQGLDSWMKLQKGSAVFDPTTENAISVALRGIRQGGNNFLAEKVPDVAVKQLLSHQSNLYQAIENIAPKAAKEGGNAIIRWIGSHPKIITAAKFAGGAAAYETAKKLGVPLP